jgi:hypothetical protein
MLQDAQRRQGGEARAKNQSDSDKRFLATLAASRRPLKNDATYLGDPARLLAEFRTLSKVGPGGDGDRPWLIFLIVGADGRTIRSTLDDKTILHHLKLVGGAIGFMGLTIFGTPQKASRAPSIQVYYKPLKAGTGTIEKLDKASRAVTAAVITAIKPVDTIKTEVAE